MFTPEEKQILLELIYEEQMNIINRKEYETKRYNMLEELKVIIRKN